MIEQEAALTTFIKNANYEIIIIIIIISSCPGLLAVTIIVDNSNKVQIL
jgi:hypothetical protein